MTATMLTNWSGNFFESFQQDFLRQGPIALAHRKAARTVEDADGKGTLFVLYTIELARRSVRIQCTIR